MILKLKTAKPILTLALLTAPCFAGEMVELSTGFRIHAERHEAEGSVVRLYENGGVTEVPASLVVNFEAEEAQPKPPAAVADTSTQLPVLNAQELIAAAARRHGLPPEFVASVVSAESDFRPRAASPKGAIGLMQLMPATAREYGADARDPRQNVEAGTQYLRDLLFKYQKDEHQVSRALAAYNAGPGAVDRYHGVPPYRETRAYVERVLRKYEKKQAKASAKPNPPSGD
jgi:soluble lytic murein transglycosylase-like protein